MTSACTNRRSVEVVNNKYMYTPQGVYEMKYFFHSGIHSTYGDSVSSVTIKQRIRKIVDSEDRGQPLSDAKDRTGAARRRCVPCPSNHCQISGGVQDPHVEPAQASLLIEGAVGGQSRVYRGEKRASSLLSVVTILVIQGRSLAGRTLLRRSAA